MQSSPSTEYAVPLWLLVSLVAGVTSGLVASLGFYFVMGADRPARSEPAPMVEPEGRTALQETDPWLEVMRDLTDALENAALAAPQPSGGTRQEIDVGSRDVLAQLAETLASLDARLAAPGALSSGLGGARDSVVKESLLFRPVGAMDVVETCTRIQGEGQQEAKQSLYLRSIEEMVERFGMPTGVNTSDSNLQAERRSGDSRLLITFTNGVVSSVFAL